jgi:hypothetical protein
MSQRAPDQWTLSDALREQLQRHVEAEMMQAPIDGLGLTAAQVMARAVLGLNATGEAIRAELRRLCPGRCPLCLQPVSAPPDRV